MTNVPNPLPGDRAKAWVRQAYARLESQSGITSRPAQHHLSDLVVDSFLLKTPLVAEAPTGTGKTLAYLVGALAAHTETGTPVVVSTATKALQQQLLTTDLPRLVAAGLTPADSVGLAKGRSNYLCLRDARDVRQGLLLVGSDPDDYVDDGLAELTPEEVEPMLNAFEQGAWSGDFDLYDGPRPRSVIRIAASSDTCTGVKCEHHKPCAYFAARKRLTGCGVVVANHDLTLIDLTLAGEGLEGTFPLQAYNVVFDEAHHLPDKALKAGSAEVSTAAIAGALPRMVGVTRGIEAIPGLADLVRREGKITLEVLDPADLKVAFAALQAEVDGLETSKEFPSVRFPGGSFPADLASAFERVRICCETLHSGLTRLNEILKEGLVSYPELPADAGTRKRFTELTNRVRDVLRVVKAVLKLGHLLSKPIRRALWVYKTDKSDILSGAPLEGADVLDTLLWQSDRVKGVSMVSATLRDIRGFDRFKRRVGAPRSTVAEAMPYTFAYAESTLTVAEMAATPKPQERPAFTRELLQKLPRYIRRDEGTLLLFPSWALLREVAPELKRMYGEQFRVQGETPVRALVRGHCNALDQGKGSILAGVATLAEGLDLPGKYCTHVGVIALPFAAPNDPVEEELAEILGKQYFSLRSLPDAMVRLTQMVGRLLRREADRGRVTVFDKRLGATSYGREMLNALPPFQKVIERSSGS